MPFKLDDVSHGQPRVVNSANLHHPCNQREPDLFVLIKRWVPEYEQEQLWDHTRRLREEREMRVRRIEMKRAVEEARAAKLIIARKKEHRSKSPGLFGFLK
jgi:phosphoketolase